jgi:hypothetical protein
MLKFGQLKTFYITYCVYLEGNMANSYQERTKDSKRINLPENVDADDVAIHALFHFEKDEALKSVRFSYKDVHMTMSREGMIDRVIRKSRKVNMSEADKVLIKDDVESAVLNVTVTQDGQEKKHNHPLFRQARRQEEVEEYSQFEPDIKAFLRFLAVVSFEEMIKLTLYLSLKNNEMVSSSISQLSTLPLLEKLIELIDNNHFSTEELIKFLAVCADDLTWESVLKFLQTTEKQRDDVLFKSLGRLPSESHLALIRRLREVTDKKTWSKLRTHLSNDAQMFGPLVEV